MEKKIKVTVQDGDRVAVYEGDFSHVIVFDGSEFHGETSGIITKRVQEEAIISGLSHSLLKAVTGIAANDASREEKLLDVIWEALLKRMHEMDSAARQPKKEPEIKVITGKCAESFLQGLLKGMRS